jgi:hypothetical protein
LFFPDTNCATRLFLRFLFPLLTFISAPLLKFLRLGSPTLSPVLLSRAHSASLREATTCSSSSRLRLFSPRRHRISHNSKILNKKSLDFSRINTKSKRETKRRSRKEDVGSVVSNVVLCQLRVRRVHVGCVGHLSPLRPPHLLRPLRTLSHPLLDPSRSGSSSS